MSAAEGRAAPGRPRVAVLNRSFKAESDRARTLVRTISAATLNRDGLVFRPFLKEGVV